MIARTRNFGEKDLVGKVAVCGGGEVVFVHSFDKEREVFMVTSFLLTDSETGEAAYESDIFTQAGCLVYELEEALEIFKVHIDKAKALGMWEARS